MTETDEGSGAPPPEGTAAHFLHFLDWAEKKGELPSSMIQNWRNASTKVLEIEDDWQNLNVVQFDLDEHINRFQILKRTNYTNGSMGAYKSRTRTAIEAYRKWLANPGSTEWKPKAGTPRTARSGEPKSTVKKSTAAEPVSTVDIAPPTGDVSGGHVPNRAAMVEYPLPLRPGVQARLWLPEDLTEKEAKRVARFAESLAFTEQLAITGNVDEGR
jgi:hypothetical protein